MRLEDLEPPLLLALKCLLVGEKLFLHSVLVDGINGRGGALEDQRDAIVPPAVLGGVVPRFDCGDFQDPPVRRQFLENGEMVLLEQANELVRLSPTGLVVAFQNIGAFLGLRLSSRRSPGPERRAHCQQHQEEAAPTSSPIDERRRETAHRANSHGSEFPAWIKKKAAGAKRFGAESSRIGQAVILEITRDLGSLFILAVVLVFDINCLAKSPRPRTGILRRSALIFLAVGFFCCIRNPKS